MKLKKYQARFILPDRDEYIQTELHDTCLRHALIRANTMATHIALDYYNNPDAAIPIEVKELKPNEI